MTHAADLDHIREGLRQAGEILRKFAADGVEVNRKAGGDPITEADLAVDGVLRELLPQPGDGWLSEETADDAARLTCDRVWVVDPLDGTKEFITAIPEWSVSIGLVQGGEPVAGGIYNPATEQMIVGAVGAGVFLNGEPTGVATKQTLDGAVVLASRSEINRGEWQRFENDSIVVQATGSVAYKLGLVAAGLCDATWTLVPKNEWDVAAGVALVRAAGGEAYFPDWTSPKFNQPNPLMPGLIASGSTLMPAIRHLLRNG